MDYLIRKEERSIHINLGSLRKVNPSLKLEAKESMR